MHEIRLKLTFFISFSRISCIFRDFPRICKCFEKITQRFSGMENNAYICTKIIYNKMTMMKTETIIILTIGGRGGK